MTGQAQAAEISLTLIERETLRDIIASNDYAATFQSLGQYRTALLQHISNLRTNDHVQAVTAAPCSTP